MDPIQIVHARLLAVDLSTLTVLRRSTAFARNGRPVSRMETVGVVVSRHRRDKFLRFEVDDGSGCVPCILWLNNNNNNPASSPAATADTTVVRLGALVRVRGRISVYRGLVQITVGDVVGERDPNAEVLHWLDCINLARQCYDAPHTAPVHP